MSNFEDFWKLYPRKVGKLAALKAWKRVNPDAATCAQIAEALAWQTEQWDDPQYIPHPTSWLNQGRWMDEQPAASRPSVPKPLQGIARWVQSPRAVNE